MSGFTPGPWDAIPCAENSFEWEVIKYSDDPAEPYWLALVYDGAEGCHAEDNAVLMSAAPDLLDAATLALDALQSARQFMLGRLGTTNPAREEALAKLARAIAKATGA